MNEKSAARSADQTASACTVYVGNLPLSASEEQLLRLFEDGPVEPSAIRLGRDPENGRPTGWAFVDLDSEDDLEGALEQLDGVRLDGRRLTVVRAGKGGSPAT